MTGITKKENINYRDIKALNYSSLKLFDDSRQDFYKQIVLGMKKREETTLATLIGNLVDFLLLSCQGDDNCFEQEFDSHFVLFSGIKSTAQVFALADELMVITTRDTNEDGTMYSSFETRFLEAFNNLQAQGKYKKKTVNQGLEDFNKTGAEYFEKLLEANGKLVVDMWMIQKAKSIVHTLRTDSNTYDIFASNGNIKWFKFPIEWQKDGVECKMEADNIEFNHTTKIVYLRDLKSTYDIEQFPYAYLKWKYYLQNAWYYEGLRWWLDMHNMQEYKISMGTTYIVCDTSANNMRPLLYQTNFSHVEEGINGFVRNGKRYRGTQELFNEIVWCKEQNIWNISRENTTNNGIIMLDKMSN